MTLFYKKTGTNNHVEAWHGSLSEDVKKNPTISGIVEGLRLEQSRTESNITILDMGNISSEDMKNKEKKNLNLFLIWLRTLILTPQI